MLARLVCFACLVAPGLALAETSAFRPLQDWPLGACAPARLGARLCLNAPEIWARFGHGAPEIEVAVVETWATHAMPQILSQHPWLSHLDIPVFWHVQRDEDLPVVEGQTLPVIEALADRQQTHALFCTARPEHPTCEGVGGGLGREAEAAIGYLGWQGRANHELKMIGLVSGQDAGSLRRTGLAPLSTVALHYIETTPSAPGLVQMSARLDRRPGTRVVNFSNQGPPDELLDLHYARIFRTALALNAGRTGETGSDPGDRLIVASSANTTGTRAIRRALPPPNRYLPPETMVRQVGAEAVGLVRADAQAAHLIAAPDVPVLVIGGIDAGGQPYAEARVEPMIDLYAPGGMTEMQIVRARGDRSTARRASEAHDAVRAMQRCAGVARATEPDGIPTLDWGPADDIRSGRLARIGARRWSDAAATLGAPHIGCDPERAGRSDIYLARAIGNSVSTALVSAVAAQMFALDPQLAAREARDILRDTARRNRVNGLPVLAARAALDRVLANFVARHVAERGRVVPGSISSRSIAPGALGQVAWRSLRDDPPLRIEFTLRVTAPGAACSERRVLLETDVEARGGSIRRRVRSETIGPAMPCKPHQGD